MADPFLTFHSFPDIDSAGEMAQVLEKNGIESLVEKAPPLLDSQIIGTASGLDVFIKIRSSDFTKAAACLANYYQEQINNIDKEYYLFSFSNEELLEVLQKPDEWSHLDYQLAQKLLADRGEPVDAVLLDKLKSERNKTLAQPEKASILLYILAWMFIFTSMLYLASPLFDLYQFTFCSSLVSFLIGRHISGNTRVLPDGQIIHSYRDSDRKRGRSVKSLSLAVFGACAVKYLWLSFVVSNS